MLTCDTLIRNANVVDGHGAAPEALDVAIRGDRIYGIAARLDGTTPETIDAEGLVLAPGFIDVHTHDDTAVITNPAMLPKLSQGITTVITATVASAQRQFVCARTGRLSESSASGRAAASHIQVRKAHSNAMDAFCCAAKHKSH